MGFEELFAGANLLATVGVLFFGLLMYLAITKVKSGDKVMGAPRGFIIFLFLIPLVLSAWQLAGYYGIAGLKPLAGVTVEGEEPPPIITGETYQPTASYAAKDLFSTTTIGGTSYYKVGDDPATTTAKTNVKVGKEYTYWVSNVTTYVEPKVFTAVSGTNDIVADGYRNDSVTLTGYDIVNHESVTGGAYNTSMGANDQANIQFTYQGTSKKSAGPFGGIFVVQYNSTISSVTCTGDQIAESTPYHLTYTGNETAHTFKTWGYTADMDDGSGSVRYIDCQFKNGATEAGADASYAITFYPANYYVTNAGDIVLDVEKFENDDTTRTGYSSNTKLFHWAA